MGRKEKFDMTPKKETRLHIRVSENLKKVLDSAAADRGITVTELVKTAIIEKIAREERRK